MIHRHDFSAKNQGFDPSAKDRSECSQNIRLFDLSQKDRLVRGRAC